MRIEGKEIELPLLLQNPFSTAPLEEGQKSLLVGRKEIFNNLTQHISFRSTRRILMVGSVGSGRTSLLRCLANVAPKALHVDHIHASAPAKSLLESLYSQLVGQNIPTQYTAIVSEMVETSKSFTGKLPLVVIDVPTVDSSVLNVALRDTLPVIERLQVLMVVVLDHKQKAHLPESVLERFDLVSTLNPLSVESVQELVNLRIRSACSTRYSLPKEDAEHLLSITDGLPASIIRVMRDAVDSNRMAQNQVAQSSDNYDSRDRRGFDTSAILPTQQPDASTTGIFTSNKGQYGDDLNSESSNVENDEEAGLDASKGQNQQSDIFGGLMDQIGNEYNEVIEKSIEPSEEGDVEILDASESWQTRAQDDELDTEQSQQNEWQEVPGSGGSLFGFDLDLEDLGDSQDNDEPLVETPFDIFNSEEIKNETVKPIPLKMAGMFGSLVGRMRDVPDAENQNQDDFEITKGGDGAELWIAKDSNLIDESNDDDLEGDGTAVLYDETSIVDGEFDEQVEYEVNDISQEESYIESEIVTNADMKTFSTLVNALQTALLAPQKPDGTIDRRKLIDALTSLRQPRVGERVDHPLNPGVLSNLSPHEAVVVATANERKYSPSDKELLQELKIKRSRLSQISNRLLRGGILNVRTVGKSRMFTLTQTARAQLTAWNMMGGES
ncbi:MAG: hypothetical protein NZ736_00505 [Candidatus Poseidoniaceae archaeon]|nr:hypothetical protein [Candidatus Poseidoniaceae archaeon]